MGDNESAAIVVPLIIGVPSILWFWYSAIKLKYRHEQLKLGLLRQDGKPVQADSKTITELREEIARLRSVSTDYDLSLQHSLEELQRRLATVEGRNRGDAGFVVTRPDDIPAQVNGRQI